MAARERGRRPGASARPASDPRSDDLELDRAALAGRGHLEQGPERLGDAAVAPDHLAHVVLGDVQLDDGALFVLDLGHLDGVGIVDERLRDVLDELLGAHLAAPSFAGRTPATRSSRATVSDGVAPFASHAFALSASMFSSIGSVLGL